MLGQRVPLSLRALVIRRLALKLCLRKAALLRFARCRGSLLDWGQTSAIREWSACESFRGAGSELGELSGRPRGKGMSLDGLHS